MRKQAATAKDGRVQQTNFDTYQMLRMNEAPAIEVHTVQNFEPPGGMGARNLQRIVKRFSIWPHVGVGCGRPRAHLSDKNKTDID